ncbi:MAG: undecaprenyl-diphosphate phosphatase [Pseudohongiellaceae bacterium]
MVLSFWQVSWLAAIQGVTEFLPISSSAHLLLPSLLLGWPDQGLTFDVAVHFGSLIAVLLYFRKELLLIVNAWLLQVFKGQRTSHAKLAWLLIMATIPAGVSGLLLNGVVSDYARALPVIGSSSIVFALLLLWSERQSNQQQSIESLNLKQMLLIGLAQAFALIPGASRSGMTMMAALGCNLKKSEAARLSFLLSIPIILASAALKTTELFQSTEEVVIWPQLLYGALISGLVAFGCIQLFLEAINRIGFLPFVIYRIALGVMLLAVYFL